MARAKLIELPLTPGLLSDDTDLAAKLHAINLDKVRIRGNRWETIKGWSQFNASGMSAGIARGAHTWADLDGNPVLLAASQSAVNAWIDGSRIDVTPKWIDVFIAKTAFTLATNLITINWSIYDPASATSTLTPHGLVVGDSVTISGVAESTGGVYDVNGTFTVASVPSTTQITLTASGTAPTLAGPDAFTVTVAWRNGLATGTGDSVAQKTRVYSIDNFGENGVFCGSDGTPIWMFQPATSYPELVTNGTFTSSLANWTAVNWIFSTNRAHLVGTVGASDLSQDVSTGLEGGKTYEMSFQVVTFSNNSTLDIKIDTIKIHPSLVAGAANGTQFQRTYTFRFVCPADPTNLIITGTIPTAAAVIDIDNVSIKLLSIAQTIAQAPLTNRALFVDGNHILASLGCTDGTGVFNPLLYRWCAQDNYRDWIPDTANIAGELTLSAGSMAICGAPVGQVNLILTDDAAFIAQFTVSGYSLTPIGQACGAVGQLSMATQGALAFWAGKTGFFAYDGARVLPIQCPAKDRYVGKLRQFQENKVIAWINGEYGEVWFHYPHTDDGTELSRYLIYNYTEQGNPWSCGTFDRTTWIRSSVFSYPIAFDTAGNVWYQETGNTMSGSITLPYIETGYINQGDGDRWLGCRRYYPDIESQTGNIQFTMTGKRAAQGQMNARQIGPLTMTPNITDKLDFLIRARQFKFKWASPSSPTQWRLGVVGLEMMSDRERR